MQAYKIYTVTLSCSNISSVLKVFHPNPPLFTDMIIQQHTYESNPDNMPSKDIPRIRHYEMLVSC